MVIIAFRWYARLLKRGVPCFYLPTFDEIVEFLLENLTDGDMVITMGCGNVDLVADELVHSDLCTTRNF